MHSSRISRSALVLVTSFAGLVACGPAAIPAAILEAPRTPPPDPRAEPSASRPAPVPEQDTKSFVGCWLEAAEGRNGCADTVRVSGSGSSLAVASEDCNDGAAYVTERVSAENGAFELALRVGSNGTRIEYTLHPGKRDTLEGKMKVTIGKEVSYLPVVWHRCENSSD